MQNKFQINFFFSVSLLAIQGCILFAFSYIQLKSLTRNCDDKIAIPVFLLSINAYLTVRLKRGTDSMYIYEPMRVEKKSMNY